MTLRTSPALLAILLGLSAAACGSPAAPPPPAEPAAPAPPPPPPPPPTEPAAPAPAPTPAPAGTSSATPQQPVPGGYAAQDPASPEMQTAAAKAVELLRARANDPSLTLKRVVSAGTQGVAGLNYQLRVELGSASGPQTLTLGLYRDLQGGYQLTQVSR